MSEGVAEQNYPYPPLKLVKPAYAEELHQLETMWNSLTHFLSLSARMGAAILTLKKERRERERERVREMGEI